MHYIKHSEVFTSFPNPATRRDPFNMPFPPSQLFASTIGTSRYLPPEIVSLILVLLNFRDLSRLALASKAWWSVASPYLWLHVGKVDNLVNLTPAVAGRNTESGSRGSWYTHYPVGVLLKHRFASVSLFLGR